MARGSWVGYDNLAKPVKNWYVGVNNAAKLVKAGWAGVDNVAKQFYPYGKVLFNSGIISDELKNNSKIIYPGNGSNLNPEIKKFTYTINNNIDGEKCLSFQGGGNEYYTITGAVSYRPDIIRLYLCGEDDYDIIQGKTLHIRVRHSMPKSSNSYIWHYNSSSSDTNAWQGVIFDICNSNIENKNNVIGSGYLMGLGQIKSVRNGFPGNWQAQNTWNDYSFVLPSTLSKSADNSYKNSLFLELPVPELTSWYKYISDIYIN